MLDRRTMITGLTAAPLVAATPRPLWAAAPAVLTDGEAYPLAKTHSGTLRGYRRGAVSVFKGIAYGRLGEGSGRFLPALAIDPWTGVRDALDYGFICPQATRSPGRIDFLLGGQAGVMAPDCLNLNVWTPSQQGRRPVMVWIHGGNYSTGSSYAFRATEGHGLASRGDVVVVSLNHRLNAFGHLDLGALGADERFAGAVNLGISDIVAALRWVRDDIAAFGGDPGNVTLFGQSGGGLKITALLAMPQARGLFHKAVVQSGSQDRLFDREMTEPLAAMLFDELGIRRGDVAGISAVPSELLGAAAARVHLAWSKQSAPGDIWHSVGWAPRIEPTTIPDQPYSSAAGRNWDPVPLLVGSTLNEFNPALFDPAAEDIDRSALLSQLSQLYRDPETLVAHFAQAYPSAKPVALGSIISATRFNRANAVSQAHAHRASGRGPAYLYRFDWQTPALGGIPRAYHCSEFPFVFANVDAEPQATGASDRAHALEARMSGAWIAFAHGRAPGHAGLPDWPSVGAEASPTMIFDDTCRLDKDGEAQARELVAAQVLPIAERRPA